MLFCPPVRRSSCHSLDLSWIRAFAALAVIAGVCACSQRTEERGAPRIREDVLAAAPARPPIVLIVADALRADRLGSYGSKGGHTPTLDAIARTGVRVERAIAPAPWSQPSIASLFTGLYPGAHGVTRYEAAFAGAIAGEPPHRVLEARFDTLAERLGRAGYTTAGFTASPFLAAAFGFDEGFDHYESPEPGESWSGEELTGAALEWLDARDDADPVFLYLHYMDAHGPYEASPERLDPLLDAVEALKDPRPLSAEEREHLGYLERLPRRAVDPARHAHLAGTLAYWRARYDGAVRELDAHLADLVAALEARGLWREALVIVTADHGEALLDGGLWDHGRSVQHVEVNVPLLWRWPGVLPSGGSAAETASLVDVLPTLLELLDLPPAPEAQGRSLARALVGQPSGDAAPVFAEAVRSGPQQRAVYRGDYKLVRSEGASGWSDRLYALEDGHPEREDLAARRPELHRALAAALDEHLRANAARASADGNGAGR